MVELRVNNRKYKNIFYMFLFATQKIPPARLIFIFSCVLVNRTETCLCALSFDEISIYQTTVPYSLLFSLLSFVHHAPGRVPDVLFLCSFEDF